MRLAVLLAALLLAGCLGAGEDNADRWAVHRRVCIECSEVIFRGPVGEVEINESFDIREGEVLVGRYSGIPMDGRNLTLTWVTPLIPEIFVTSGVARAGYGVRECVAEPELAPPPPSNTTMPTRDRGAPLGPSRACVLEVPVPLAEGNTFGISWQIPAGNDWPTHSGVVIGSFTFEARLDQSIVAAVALSPQAAAEDADAPRRVERGNIAWLTIGSG